MRVLLLHEEIGDDASPDAEDTLIQVEAVAAALLSQGHETACATFGMDLAENRRRLAELAPDVTFNLVESLGGTGRLIHIAPALLESMGMEFTGCSAAAIHITSGKLLSKERLAACGLPTPAWYAPSQPAPQNSSLHPGQTVILKSVWEHASLGIDDASIVDTWSFPELDALAAARCRQLGGECFFEAFIPGREFNLGILDGPGGPELLPAAEIIFENFGDRPRIVGYRAKWIADAFEYASTPRRFVFAAEDQPLVGRLGELALECWRIFGLKGYARVDFRVDRHGAPWILEVNANPCLSPDAGFAAALGQAGIGYADAIARIVRPQACRHRRKTEEL